MRSYLLQFCALLALTNGLQCARILAVFPMAAPSHYILGSSLLKALAEQGHDVTMISPFAEKNPPKNGSYRDIVLTGFREEHEKHMKEVDLFGKEDVNMIFMMPFFIKMMAEMSENTLKHPNVQKLINSEEKFDVVVVELMLEAHKAFASHFKASLIMFSTIGTNGWVNPSVGNPTPLAYVSDALIGYSSKMTLPQKMVNTFMYIFQQTMNRFYVHPRDREVVKKYFPGNLNLDDVMYNVSIVLLNSHPSLNQPVPYVPNMIDIGGFHVNPPKKLPQDLQKFLDDAKEGVIYFSMGSNLKSAHLPQAKREALLKAFSKLKQKVLWKWEEDVLPGQPANVHLGKWIPQQDVLAHPNVKLFITHSGLLSTIETIYHGVPVVAIPIGGDQKLNAKQVVNQGYGVLLPYSEISEESVTDKINEVLTNPKYTETAKERSKLFHDRLVKPIDTAVYWVEYVILKGAPHLRVAGVDLPWYKYLLLDVIAVVALAGLITLYLSFRLWKLALSYCCKKKTQKIKSH